MRLIEEYWGLKDIQAHQGEHVTYNEKYTEHLPTITE